MQKRLLDGKVAIVTGAASPRGLGRAMTEALVKAGARVSMMDINQQWLDETSNYMREIGGDDCVMTQIVDVSSIGDVERSIERTIEELGGLHILVNNAGIAPRNMLMGGETSNNFWEISAEEWDRVVSVNSSGPFYMPRTVVPHMPSKAAHEALVAMASRELEGTGVTVNVLVPGGMASTDLIPDDTDHQRENMINPEVMQAPVVWLASEASDGINGQRFIGYYWDEDLPLEERLEKAAAPAAWPQLGAQAIRLG